ncbi:MAG: SurA N-terminal domain-containing protein [Hyphomicrobiaceae bacterium]
MMEALRRGASGWIAKIFLSLLILSFAVWGVADVFTGYGQRSLARIGATEISSEEFQQAFQQEISMVSRQVGRRLTPEQARSFGLDTRALSRLIGSAAISTHAHDLGLAVPDSDIAAEIRTDPDFKGITGNFDRAAFNEMLRQNGITESRYFRERKSAEVREQLTDALLEGTVVAKTPVEIMHRYREEQRTIASITLDPEKAAKVPEPDEAKFKAYYEQNKASFVTPETRKLNILLLTTQEAKKLVPVSDEEVRASYDRNPERFNDPEKRRILQLSFPDMAAAEKAAAELAKAPSFEEGAKALGFKESDYDLGLLTRAQIIDPAIANAAFALEKGKASAPIAGQFTNVILRVMDVQPGKQRTYEEVKPQIAEQLAIEASGRAIQELHDKVDDARGGGKSLQEIADMLKLRFAEVPATDRSGKAPDGKPALDQPEWQTIVRAAFSPGAGIDREAAELQDGYAWIDLAGTTPERQKPYEEVQAEVKSQWLDTETKQALASAAQAAADKVNGGATLESVAGELGLKVETSKPFKRIGPTPVLAQSGVRQAFALAKGKAASIETPDGKSRSIVVVTEITPAEPPTKEQTEQLTAELTRQLQGDTLAEYVSALQTRYGVSVNETVLKRTLGVEQ